MKQAGKRLCVVLAVLLLITACGTAKNTFVSTAVPPSAPTASAAATTLPPTTAAPTATPVPTASPSPTPTPEPTEIPMSDPVLTLIGGDALTVDADFTFTDPGAEAADYLGIDLSDRISVEGEVISYLVGVYTLTYSVTDDYGNTTQKTRTVTVQPVAMPEIVQPPEKTVYLTFDDGPCVYTEQLLDVLAKYDVKVTFFVIGNKGRADLIKRAYEEGHSIGVHSYTHEYNEIYASEEAFFRDFLATEEVIFEQTGSNTRIFRFPGGSANTASIRNPGIMTRLTKIMEDMGYRYFDWNVSSGDASGQKMEPDAVSLRICSGMQSHPEFSVVLQHDIKYFSVSAVESVLRWGLKQGYTFLPLDLTSPVMHSVPQN